MPASEAINSAQNSERADHRGGHVVAGREAGPGRRGEFAFRVGRREIGHLHGDHAAHFSFPKTVWARVDAQRRIEPHPVFPDAQGPAARRIDSEDDVGDVIALMRLNYDRIAGAPASGQAEGPMSDGDTAIVTGGSRGLGLALARELARRGWRLVIDARGRTSSSAPRAS